MLKVAQQAPQSRRHDSWPDFCEQLGTASLTLVGFEKQDLSKVYDALDLCSKTRNIQAVEVFIRTLDELDEAQSSVAPGLCMIYMPDFQQGAPYHKALLLLSDLAEYDTVTVIPVLKPYESKRSILDAIGCACPAYLNPDSELRDFVAMFSAFLFPAQRDQKAPHRDFASVGPELTFAV